METEKTVKTFSTGAKREDKTGKGRCDLLPTAALIRLSKHFENGAGAHGERNWEKGIPMHSFLDSGMRHLLKYMDGQTDEDHLCAAAWNILCALETEEKRPEMQDIPSRLKVAKKTIEVTEPARIAPPDLRSMKGQMVYFVPFMDDEKPRWMQVVLDFITNPAMKMWALYKNPDDFMYLSEIEDLGMVFTGECNPELTEAELEKMDGQKVWVDWGPEAIPDKGINSAFYTVKEKDLHDVNNKNNFGGFRWIGSWRGWPKVYRYEKTDD